MQHDADRAGAAPRQRDEAGVSAECSDVPLDPAQRRHLVFHAVVTGRHAVAGAQPAWNTDK